MEESSLTYKTFRNSTYLFTGFILSIAFTVFVTRTMVVKLGTFEYGIFLLVNVISAFITYVDLGLSTAVTKYVAEYLARREVKNIENILSSAQLIFFLTGMVGLLVFFVLGKWYLPVFNIPPGSMRNIFLVFIFAGITFLLNSLTVIYTGFLSALQRFDLLTKINLGNLIVTSLGTIALLYAGYQLKVIMILNILSTFFLYLCFRYYCHKLMPELSLRFIFVKEEIKKAYKFGFLTFISNLAGSFLVYFDRLLIPMFLGPSQLAFYSVPGNVALKIPGITNSLAGMLFPLSSSLSGLGDREKLKTIYIKVFRNLSVISAALAISILLFAYKILYFWLGQEYAERGTNILIILAVAYYFIGLYIPLQSILLGMGKLKFLIKISVFMAVINLILLLLFVPKYGILGAAWAYLFSILPMIFAFYWVEKNIFNFNSGRFKYYAQLYTKLLFISILYFILVKFFILQFITNAWILVIVGPLSVLLYIMLYYVFKFFDKEDKIMFKNFILKFFRFKKFIKIN